MLAGVSNRVLRTIYPPRCLACAQATDNAPGLCAECWSQAAFISGAICEICGVPVPGEATEGALICDGCTGTPPAWDRGRAVFLYEGSGRRMVLALKHSDRLDMVPQLARWMHAAAGALAGEADIIAPVPLHWFRLFRRRFNQSAELARQLARLTGGTSAADLLVRKRATPPQHGRDRAARHANMADAFAVHPRWAEGVRGKRVLLVDDVMTSGATLSACTEVCRIEGAANVDVCVLARVAQAV